MDKLIIEGGIPLKGTITVSGSKNAALPILIASILLSKKVTLHNIPQLKDIRTTIKLLEILGCTIQQTEQAIELIPGSLYHEAPYELVCTMRASILVLGPLLAKLGKAKVAMPGGCAIGARPIDLHLKALEKMGAKFTLKGGYLIGYCDKLKGTRIHLDFPTVGGTENLLIAAVLAEGETILENAAQEPEIEDLSRFLITCGAIIEGHGTNIIHIQGVPKLTGCTYSIMPDRIEAATFLTAAAITKGELLVSGCPYKELEAIIDKFIEMGIQIEKREDGIYVAPITKLKATDITTRPFPGFPTDMQAQTMALMSIAHGTSTVNETIFENRFMHVQELARMGANIRLNGHTAIITGVKELTGAPVMASDLRASASLVLAGLAAKGITTIQRTYHLDRGYEFIEKKLNAVGASIQRINE